MQISVEENSEALQMLQRDGTSSLQADQDVLARGKKVPESLNAEGICRLRNTRVTARVNIKSSIRVYLGFSLFSR